MSDVKRYVRERAKRDPEFAKDYEIGYTAFKIGVLLRAAREEAGLTQEQVAQQLKTKKSAISRIENHAGDIRLSTLQKYAQALGRELAIEIRPFVSYFEGDDELSEEPEQEEPLKTATDRTARRRASV